MYGIAVGSQLSFKSLMLLYLTLGKINNHGIQIIRPIDIASNNTELAIAIAVIVGSS